ncbi:MAG: dCTP deaminase [Candidatus Sulfotelmatobacter sp.]
MVLTDREIQSALQSGQIIVNPPPNELAYSSTSLDLTLSEFLQEWQMMPLAKGVEQTVSPADPDYQYSEFAKRYSKTRQIRSSGYVLEPRTFVLGETKETIELPTTSRLAARVEGKSSLARLGIGVHVTAPTIHAGFVGTIKLEICNHGPLKVKLLSGMRVCQLIFEQTLGTAEKGYRGQFQYQGMKKH